MARESKDGVWLFDYPDNEACAILGGAWFCKRIEGTTSFEHVAEASAAAIVVARRFVTGGMIRSEGMRQ